MQFTGGALDRFRELTVFLRVVATGSFSRAARDLTLNPSTVSKLISRIEERLGTRLFARSSRIVRLTADGEVFRAGALRALEALEETEVEIASSRTPTSVKGSLRIHSLPAFARYQLAPRMPAFLARYPDLHVEFLLSNEIPNFIEQKIDISIQSGELVDSALIGRKLGTSRWVICAAPSYLAAHGTPVSPADLKDHNCLNFTPEIPFREWPVVDSGTGNATRITVSGNISSNHGEMLLDLARLGIGIVRLAEFHIGDDLRKGSLVPLLREYQNDEEEPIHALYLHRRLTHIRVRTFLDFLEESFGTERAPWAAP
jgi:DNA-binding transcriptional LysR family regulator